MGTVCYGAVFVVWPYLLFVYGVYCGVIFIVDRCGKPLSGNGGLVMLGPPMVFVFCALFYFPL
jgi:hypothetical protein